jgi:hypothetical protein
VQVLVTAGWKHRHGSCRKRESAGKVLYACMCVCVNYVCIMRTNMQDEQATFENTAILLHTRRSLAHTHHAARRCWRPSFASYGATTSKQFATLRAPCVIFRQIQPDAAGWMLIVRPYASCRYSDIRMSYIHCFVPGKMWQIGAVDHADSCCILHAHAMHDTRVLAVSTWGANALMTRADAT